MRPTALDHHRPSDRPSQQNSAPRVRARSHARLALRWFNLLCAPIIFSATISYTNAMRTTGNLSNVERTVEWLRGHHYGALVSDVEAWYYSHHQPSTHATLASIPHEPPASPPPGSTAPAPTGIQPIATNPLPGEGTWQPLGDPVNGTPAMQVAYLRPDELHGSVLAAVVRIDQRLATFALVPGLQEPGNGPWPTRTQLDSARRTNLIAAFNSGFRIADARGGFALAGHQSGTLRDGAATAAISNDGTLSIGAWGTDITTTDHPIAVRQNLDLIVEHGTLTPGLDDNTGDRWGHTVGNRLYVWRSGLGIDAQGRILYAASSGLTVSTLARLLQRAGAVNAMELDINHSWVSFNTFHHPGNGNVSGTKLLTGMSKPADRYLHADSRDFFAVLSRRQPTP